MVIADFKGPCPVTRRRLAVSDAVIAAEVDQETVLLDVASGTYFGLDDVGTDIWKLLPHCDDEAVLVARLQEIYDAHPEVVARDVAAFLDDLVAQGVLIAEGT